MGNNIFKDKKAFNFYRSYYDTSLLLDGDDRLQFLQAILNYQFTGNLIEPKSKFALLAFRGQMHSLKKQVIGFAKGKETYPNGNPTKGKNKGKGKGSDKQEQEKEEEEVQDKYKLYDYPFSKIKDFQTTLKNFTLNKSYFYIAYRFWELWKKENPSSKTLLDATILNWYQTIRKIIEIDNQKIERLILIFFYFDKCQRDEAGFDRFWFDTIKSVGGLRRKDKDGVYRIDVIMDKVNYKIQSDDAFNRLINSKIKEFKQYESAKLH